MEKAQKQMFTLRVVLLLSIAFSGALTLFPSEIVAQETFRPEEATIAGVHAAMKAGKLTCRALVQMYLDRIEAYDKKGPVINAIMEINPDALALADGLDEKFAKSGPVGPLHCIPVILKDNYDTGDKMTTTAGSRTLEGFKASKDAFLVKQLRDAGAVILAKANMDEWAHAGAPGMGYSSRGGQTINPYNSNRGPLGSSSGTGAALAANFAVVGMGTDTHGSIRYPSAGGCLVGIKPTLGLTSRTGIIPLSLNFDVGGPMTRTVEDAAITLGVLAGVDVKDPATFESVGKYHKDYTKFLKIDGLRGARLGITRMFLGGNEDNDRAYLASIEVMKKKGATLIDPVAFPKDLVNNFSSIYNTIRELDFKWNLAEYLASAGPKAPVKTLAEVIAISENPVIANSKTPVAPDRLKIMKRAEARGPLTDPVYLRTLQSALPAVRNMILEIMKDKNLDAIIFPTLNCPPEPWGSIKDPSFKCVGAFRGAQSSLASLSGFPQIVVPDGFAEDGLPLSISFLAGPYSEPMLLSLAYSYEQATKHRRPPKSAPPLK